MSRTGNTVTPGGTDPAADADTGTDMAGGPAAAVRRGLLHGLPWLVWRRHRALLRTGLLITAAGCATFAYQRIGLMDFLHTKGASARAGSQVSLEFQNTFGTMFSRDVDFLQLLPLLAGLFLGAPLIAGEQERGTLRLVTTQSASRGRWLAATLGLPLALVVLCTTLLSAAFTWLWSPAHALVADGNWLESGAFDTTGPVPVATALFLTSCGIALGMLIRRVTAAMAATAILSVIASVIWDEKVRPLLGTLRSVSYPYGGDGPPLPAASVRIDDWVSTADGRLYGFGTCTTGDAEACRAKLGIVNRVTQYFDYGQMAGMQWLGAGILLALAAVVLACAVWRAHRRPL
ncbi:ABC transporter permease subunit [Streptomyces sp. DSM 41527]|uniref:ABC transporter permease subunit n=1 Tax=Streptomyces mooreae TaxID=3075523 RepID=A0ABU2TB64_9ACTN|nr:ABC transporter permease subunit [Streptomyces sp. DSM 41527]MDT0458159.1 ABC transporter permease subunit [Streptomyces sp. DSM 41527]